LEFSDTQVSGKTNVYGLIGDPVDHSLSPLIQNTAFHSSNIDAVYVAFPVRASALKSAVQGLLTLGVKGFNVTTPHKVAITKYLDRLDQYAAQIGSVNTVTNKNGALLGYSTDGIGAVRAVEEVSRLDEKNVLILGAGGAGKAIAFAFAPKVGSLKILNRTVSRARDLERRLRKSFQVDVRCGKLTELKIKDLVIDADIVVNASALGMEGNKELPIRGEWLGPRQLVFEIVYRPIETRLIKQAKQAGAKTLTGLDMLVHQGACSFELWTGKKAPVGKMRQAIFQHLMAMSHASS
jgi:shikimate dehydrogenase